MIIFTKKLYFSVKWLLLPIVVCIFILSTTKDISAQVCIGSRVVDLGTGCNSSCQQTYSQITTNCSSFPFCDVTLRFEACISDGPGLCHVEDQFRIYECWEASPTSGPGTIDCGTQTCNSSTEQCCFCGCKAIGSDCAIECGSGGPTATPIPTSTPMPTSTPTPIPTSTPVPTATPIPPTPTPTYDKQLHIRGSVVARVFNLLRDLGSAVTGEVNDLYPGEFFEYGTEQVIAFPPFLRFRPTLWTEVSP